LAISSDSFSSTITLDSPSISQINPIMKHDNLNPKTDIGTSRRQSEKGKEIESFTKENKLLNNLNKKESEMEMFYFDPTESPARKTLMKNVNEKAKKGFPKKNLLQNSSTPNPDHFIQSEENTQTLSKFYFSPDSKTLNSQPDFKFKPPTSTTTADVEAENLNQSIKPSFQYQHQNIFKTILRSKHFQTLRRTCDACQNAKSNCICSNKAVENKTVLKTDEMNPNKTITKSNHYTKPKSKLQRLIHEFYLPSNVDLKKEKSSEDVNKDIEVDPSLKNKTFNQIKTRTKEKFKSQMKEWANSLNIGTNSNVDDCPSISTKTVIRRKSNFEDPQKLNIRLRSRVKKQLKQYEHNSIVGTKKKRSKRIEWRPLVGDQIPKSSKQILQEISVIAKNKAKNKSDARIMKNETMIKSKTKPRDKYKYEENDDDDDDEDDGDDLIDTISITLNNDDTIVSNKKSCAVNNFSQGPNKGRKKVDFHQKTPTGANPYRTKAITSRVNQHT